MDSLSLGQYIDAFSEGAVDGPFLMELREEDLVQVLGVKHKLHVRKILTSREKLKPLSQQELKQKQVVELEEKAAATRNEFGVPTLDTVFSQARNGRIKRVQDSLNAGTLSLFMYCYNTIIKDSMFIITLFDYCCYYRCCCFLIRFPC